MYEAGTQKVWMREIHLGVTVTWMGDEGMGVAWGKGPEEHQGLKAKERNRYL